MEDVEDDESDKQKDLLEAMRKAQGISEEEVRPIFKPFVDVFGHFRQFLS